MGETQLSVLCALGMAPRVRDRPKRLVGIPGFALAAVPDHGDGGALHSLLCPTRAGAGCH